MIISPLRPQDNLTAEHKIIENMLGLLYHELGNMESRKDADMEFIKAAADFFFNYCDKVHHAKEEVILFSKLEEKGLSPELNETVDKLKQEHKEAVLLSKDLHDSAELFIKGDAEKIGKIMALLEKIMEIYPPHIHREDEEFFVAAMNYFSDEEKKEITQEFLEFDGNNKVHEKYDKIIKDLSSKKATGTDLNVTRA